MDEKLLLGESKNIEYKRDYTKTMLKTVSAYANYHDGYILIGVEDSGEVTGVSDSESIRLSIENAINDSIRPKPYYEICEEAIGNKVVVIVKVFKGDHTPYTLDNKAYKRMDTSSVSVDRLAYEELILLGRNLTFETLVSNEQDLFFKVLQEKMEKSLNISHFTEDLLITLRLKNKTQYNNAAALISDTNPLESSGIQLIAYDGDNVLKIKDRQKIEKTSVLKQFDFCIDFYRKHINTSELINGPYRKTIEEVPIVAYREAIANAIVHRDYSRNVDLRIEYFSNRIEIVSPGGLPVGITENEYLDGRVSIPRNMILADIFLRLKIIERLATGIRRIKEYYNGFNVRPQFQIHENSIVVILPKVNKIDEIDYSPTVIEKLDLNKYEIMIYKALEDGKALSRTNIENTIGLKKSQTIELINHLIKLNLVVQIGRGRAIKYVLKSNNQTK